MLKYSCTVSRLANWVLRQVCDQPGFLFPKRKGWNARVKLHYSGEQGQAIFLISVYNESELLAFVPVSAKSDISQLKSISNPKQIKQLKKELGHSTRSFQMVYLTCDRDELQVTKLLKQCCPSPNLMVLGYEGMAFNMGNFKNPRLEYRLSVQELDTDLIPNLLPESHQLICDGITNALFFQNILFNIKNAWIKGQSKLKLRTVLKETVPYWKQYRKKDQQRIIFEAKEELNTVFKDFFGQQFSFSQSSPKGSDADVSIAFPKLPESRKEMNLWARKQELALDYFRDEGKQISIEGLDLFLDSQIAV